MTSGLIIEVNRTCNLKCKFCPVPISNKIIEVPFDVIEDTLKNKYMEEYKHNGKFKHLSISGGEPFLHTQIERIIDLFARVASSALIVSNMTVNKKSVIEKIKEHSNVFLQISVVAFDRELYLELTGKDLFERFLKNIENAVKVIGSEKIYANITVNKLNEKNIISIINGAIGTGIKNIRIAPVVATNEKMVELLPENYRGTTELILDKYLENLLREGIDLKIVVPKTYKTSYYDYLKPIYKEGKLEGWSLETSLFTAYFEGK